MTDEQTPMIADEETTKAHWAEALDPDKAADRLLAATRSGRPPRLGAPLEDDTDYDPRMSEALAQQDKLMRSVQDQAAESLTRQQLELSQMIGRVQAADFFHQLTGMARLKWLSEIKESKAYKGCKGFAASGELIEIRTFDELCDVIGVSRSKTNEDLQNLRVLGEEYMEAAQRIGLGYREIRKLRQLPEEDRQLVIAGEKVGNDPEALKDLLEELVAKQARDKEALKTERDSLKGDLEASRKLTAERTEALDKTRTELIKLKSLSPDEETLAQAQKEADALKELYAEQLKFIGQFGAYVSRVRALLALPGVHHNTREAVAGDVSSLCRTIADTLLAEGLEIDFRTIVYPREMFPDEPRRGEEEIADLYAPANPGE